MKLNPKHFSTYSYIAIAGIAVIYVISKWIKGMKPAVNPDDLVEDNTDVTVVLKIGDERPEVAILQRILKDKYKQNLGTFGDNKDGIDGIFGIVTQNALFKAKGVKQISLDKL